MTTSLAGAKPGYELTNSGRWFEFRLPAALKRARFSVALIKSTMNENEARTPHDVRIGSTFQYYASFSPEKKTREDYAPFGEKKRSSRE